ncbi:hypothetical protein QU593_10425 [Rossellomorea marisflavi]|uniref:hypothetical protein n=1 Tax=Rossellomorea marisflavi TaxID=189381 RepID=UPI0025B24130|nr:hypothetical protein [Rossellomorea marisflavi]WJV20821.1 hypothetical protein QU593_10425 [Rossellomorea marisflavi]
MNTDFFKELKRLIMTERRGKLDFFEHVRHYETLLQNKTQLNPLLDDIENWNIEIKYYKNEESSTECGKYIISLSDYQEGTNAEDNKTTNDQGYASYEYQILLTSDERDWGTCECVPEHENYNPERGCCGTNCSWVAPAFTIKKIYESSGTFKGLQRDMWQIEEEWQRELDEYDENAVLDKINEIEENIARLIKEKEEILNNK